MQDCNVDTVLRLPEPQDLATEAVTELEAVIDDLKEIIDLVEKEGAWRNEFQERFQPDNRHATE